METPRAPRKSTGGVDVQLEEFETDLRTALEIQLCTRMNMPYWYEMDEISEPDRMDIHGAINDALADLTHRYSAVPQISAVLEHCRILIQNVVWASMNVPWPELPDLHIERVIANAIDVYNRVIYAHLRTEMIMANHNAEVLQRNWRRCITDPSHMACRRRLMYEFEQVRNLDPNSL